MSWEKEEREKKSWSLESVRFAGLFVQLSCCPVDDVVSVRSFLLPQRRDIGRRKIEAWLSKKSRWSSPLYAHLLPHHTEPTFVPCSTCERVLWQEEHTTTTTNRLSYTNWKKKKKKKKKKNGEEIVRWCRMIV